MARIQNNLLAKPERWLLDRLCRRLGPHVTSDQMTLLGVLGGVMALCADIAGRSHRALLWLAVLGYVLHWFGDSLDGSIARFQGKQRPRYGFFIDHGVDALTNFMIMVGIGLSGHVRLDVALLTLVGYFMLTIYVLLKQHVMSDFQLSFLVMGPTELRICLIAMTVGMISLGDFPFVLMGQRFTAYDVILSIASLVFVALFVFSLLDTGATLRKADASSAPP